MHTDREVTLMSIKSLVSVNRNYTRSINLERDSNSLSVVKSYIPTSSSLRALESISSSFNAMEQTRAWSLVGPYGSGKSSFTVFLSHLLSSDSNQTTKEALKILAKSDKTLAQNFRKNNCENGFLKVLITGTPESFGNQLAHSIADAASSYWETLDDRRPRVISMLNKCAHKKPIEHSELIKNIKLLQEKLTAVGCLGILLIIDELGKFLEYEARHDEANDIYLLQKLAELGKPESSKTNLYLIVLLHQSIQDYANEHGNELRKDWTKISGRFTQIPFTESPEQILRVVSAAFKHEFNVSEKEKIQKKVTRTCKVLIREKALPISIENHEAHDLFTSCYPLHPVSAMLLPMLCQKVAQNERTLFTYLGSNQEYGLQRMLETMNSVEEFILPYHIYDYFIANQSAVMVDKNTHKRWIQIANGIDRLGDASEDEVNLLKTIGIMSIVGIRNNFKASKPVLEECFQTKSKYNIASEKLSEKKYIKYRQFSKCYQLWEGSDFDIDDALARQKNEIGAINIPEELNKQELVLPLVVRKYNIEKGVLRYFMPYFIDDKFNKIDLGESNQPRILFYLVRGREDKKQFTTLVEKGTSDSDIYVQYTSGPQLRESIIQAIALNRIEQYDEEIESDKIAQQEVRQHLTECQLAQRDLLNKLYNSPEEHQWWFRGKKLFIKSKRDLQNKLSQALEGIFTKSLVVKNELINKDVPSSQANGAIRKLLKDMVNNGDKEDLGIAKDKFPPEKSIYRAFLHESGIHTQSEHGAWFFTEPKEETDKINILPAWRCIEDHFEKNNEVKKPIFDEKYLNKKLMTAPYGIKGGVLCVLYFTYYMVNKERLAVFYLDRYIPHMTSDLVERFLKRPDEFTFQLFDTSKFNLHESYFQALGRTGSATILGVATIFANVMAQLNEFARNTKQLTPRAQAVRDAYVTAESPNELLIESLPKILGYSLDTLSENRLESKRFSDDLSEVISEISKCYENMMQKQLINLQHIFNISTKNDKSVTREIIKQRFEGLVEETSDRDGLKAFLQRLLNQDYDADSWFYNILEFLGKRPPKKWLDGDIIIADQRLVYFAKSANDLLKLKLEAGKYVGEPEDNFDIYLLRSVKRKSGPICDEVVHVNKEVSEKISSTKNTIKKDIDKIEGEHLKLALLSELINDYLRTKIN